MKRTLAVAVALVLVPALAQAHGGQYRGQYRGPGDRVPPGGGRWGGNSGPASPGPAEPQPGAVSSPGRPGAAAPGRAPSTPQRGASAQGQPAADATTWNYWWEFNKQPYLDLKSAIHSGAILTGSEGFFLGRGQRLQGRDSLAPSEEEIRQLVVPALQRALADETNNDIVTACLIALAKIGDPRNAAADGGDGSSEFEPLLAAELSNPVQEIAETAAVSLGILASEASVPTLASLLLDEEAGRELVGSQEVSDRTRAFAAYGLALIGARTESEEVRLRIVELLHRALEEDETRTFDLSAACVIALGLVPLETLESPSGRGADAGAVASRADQVDYLLRYLADEDHKYLVRAHCPIALARLVGPAPGALPPALWASWRERVAEDLIRRIRTTRRTTVAQSCILGLGLLGDLDADPLDRRIRATIAGIPEALTDQLARNFSTIAMARLAGHPGSGERAEGLAEAADYLARQLVRGKSSVRPWAALSIGVMCSALRDDESTLGTRSELTRLLRTALEEETNDQEIGAYAIGAAIAGDVESGEILLAKLEDLRADEPRGYLSVALGLLGDRTAVEPIQEIVRQSQYRPDLLKQAAIGLGLLGDKELLNELVVMLQDAKGLSTQAAISSALGTIGDRRSIEPLVGMLENEDLTDRARAFAAVALGIVADKEPLPWNSKIGVDLNYRAAAETLNDPNGTGILNIL